MKRKDILKSFSFGVFIALGVIIPQISCVGQIVKYSNEYMSIGVGARQLALAGAQTASIDDVYACYWNPAGLTHQESNLELAAMHNEYYAGMASLDFMALGFKASDSVRIGLAGLRFGNDNIPNTLDLIDATGAVRYDKIKSFSAVDYGFLFSLARLSKIPHLRLGLSCKVLYRSVGSFGSAWGFGFDAGAQYKYKKFLLGAMLFDGTTSFNAWWWNTSELKNTFAMTGNDLPQNRIELTMPRCDLAVARHFELGAWWVVSPSLACLFTFDGKRNTPIRTNIFSIDPHFATELSFRKMAFLRVGFKNFQSVANADNKKQLSFEPCFGVGLIIRKLSIDYALTNMGGGIGLYSNVLSIRYMINRKS